MLKNQTRPVEMRQRFLLTPNLAALRAAPLHGISNTYVPICYIALIQIFATTHEAQPFFFVCLVCIQ